MTDPLERTQALLGKVSEEKPDLAHVKQFADALLECLPGASEEVRLEVLERLSHGLQHTDPQVGGIIAYVCGAIVEVSRTIDPLSIGQAMVEGAVSVLQGVIRFHEHLEREYPATEDNEDEEPDDAFEVDGRLVPREIMDKIVAQDRPALQSWFSFEGWGLALIAVLSRSRELRQIANASDDFRESVEQLSYSGDFLRMAMRLLDDVVLLVLHPESKQGFQLRMTGVADNFQLHILLADLLVARPATGLMGRLLGQKSSGLPGAKPSKTVARVMWGQGGPSIDEAAHGVWNLYDWRSAKHWSEIVVTKGSQHSNYWIWGEGIPADIPTWEGMLVILLGEPSYPRSFDSARRFPALVPTVVIEETLGTEAVGAWMKRFHAAA